MSNDSKEISVVPEKDLLIWESEESLKEIRNIFAKNATDNEFRILCELGRATGLSPFLKQIWFVKYGNDGAQIFIGRDGYRVGISRHKKYEGHFVDAVYSNDNYKYSMDGTLTHDYNMQDRGKLIGAFCIAWMKDRRFPYYVYVPVGEYDTGKSTWSTKKSTQIKKVAESQCCRMAAPDMFAATYDGDAEYFDPREEKQGRTIDVKSKLQSLIDNKTTPSSVTDTVFPSLLGSIESVSTADELKAVEEVLKNGITEVASESLKAELRQAYKKKAASFKQPKKEPTDEKEIAEGNFEIVKEAEDSAKVRKALEVAEDLAGLESASKAISGCPEADKAALVKFYLERRKTLAYFEGKEE